MTTIKPVSIPARLLLLFMLAATLPTWSATAGGAKFPGGHCWLYRVWLTDKQGGPYSLSRPREFLSEKSLERRRRQGLPLDSTDLPITPNYIIQVEGAGTQVVSRSKWNNTLVVRVKKADTAKSLLKLPCVKAVKRLWASPDSLDRRPPRSTYESDFNLWNEESDNPFGATYDQVSMLNGDRLHGKGWRGQGKTIAVLDGGFMNADVIPALQQGQVVGHADFVYPTSDNIFSETEHGTMVLSTMAANVPNLFMGTAPQAQYWLLRTEETRSETMVEEDFWAAGVEFADSVGADIVSSSLSYHDFDDDDQDYIYKQLDGSSFISHTASMLAAKGIVLVNSAGNDGMGTWKKVSPPADARDIITVGAVSADRKNAAFSSIGPTADGRLKPDVMAVGSPTTVITGRGVISKNIGTSFSTPLVAGMVACLWQACPGKTAREIIEMVRACADNNDCPDNIFGFGIPDFWKAYTSASKSEE